MSNEDEDVSGVEALFEKHGDTDFLRFERIPEADRRHPRPDVCAFIYLHEKLGGEHDAVAGAEHDEIYLAWEVQEVEKLTEEDVIYLTRCGVRYGDCGLCMFV